MIIDPLRDIQTYIDLLAERKATLKYIFETHFHADFVSGHIDLALKTGATIVYGPTAVTKFKSYICKDEEVIKLGKIQIKVLHTPGHTLESCCFVLVSEEKPFCVFTGDTLFMGDVGRPDLAVKGEDLKVTDLAAMLYKSIESKIKPLGDDLWVYPAHGAGSACGKNIGTGVKCQIGTQKKNNYALQPMSEEEFVNKITYKLPPPPSYFFYDAFLNKEGPELFEKVFERCNISIKLNDFEKRMGEENTIIIDARDLINITHGYIPSSLGITLKCPFSKWVGNLVKPRTNILIVCENGSEKEALTQLGRIGYDHVLGYLEGGFDTWKNADKPINKFKCVTPEEMLKIVEDKEKVVIDVREPFEWDTGVIGNSLKISVQTLEERYDEVPKDKDVYLYCRTGIRGVMAATKLQKHGFSKDIYNITGGYVKMLEQGHTVNK